MVSTFTPEQIDGFGAILNDTSKPLKARFRALFILRNIGCDLSVKWIAKCFGDDSALLKHELAYCLGQTQNKTAIPILTEVLMDTNQEPIVRHEAGEALGAIGDASACPVLEKYMKCTTGRARGPTRQTPRALPVVHAVANVLRQRTPNIRTTVRFSVLSKFLRVGVSLVAFRVAIHLARECGRQYIGPGAFAWLVGKLVCEVAKQTSPKGNLLPASVGDGRRRPTQEVSYCRLIMNTNCNVTLGLDRMFHAYSGCSIDETEKVLLCHCGTHMCSSFIEVIWEMAQTAGLSEILSTEAKEITECFNKLRSNIKSRTSPEIFPEAEGCSDTGVLSEQNAFYLEPVMINGKEEYVLKSNNPRLQAQLLSPPELKAT
ncbi:hypothetical protein Y032_0291g1559 [Ancylostoma ceylanicum]|uniref:Deoxyhypusine monooxygenase n=1 Tax=Ancylostoma ceylanicum TaxID=53326 RepID=A0A016S5J7_9BILA|nr:hypothetical protein Y032_0291g1559 [Ancylostoma ceylanicum]